VPVSRGGAGLALGILLALTGPAIAQKPPANINQPVLLKADELTYEQDLGVVTARGHVELSQDDRILLADMVSYNERTDTVIASGNVSLLEPTGEVLFGEYVELNDSLRSGFIRNVGILLADNSRAAADSAVRTDGNRTVLDHAVYSPCELCAADRTRAPLWQIKAVKIVHDQEKHRIQYKDATFEVFGIPVAYTPYFSHADPTVKRESGFLPPSYGHNQQLGFTLEVPYYYAISPSMDATITPEYTSLEGPVLKGEFRERTSNGQYRLDGSITRVDARDDQNLRTGQEQTRGHIRGSGRFNIDETWKWGFDGFRSTDDTYLRLYRISTLDTLTSNAFVEGINGRNYASANVYSFQGLLQQDSPGLTPTVLPLLDYSYVGDPSPQGYFSLDANVISLYRTSGLDTRRFSTTAAWKAPYIAPAGDVYTLTAQLRGDFYWLNQGSDQFGTVTPSGVDGRLLPLVALDWRYPFVRTDENVRAVIEPIIVGVLAPYGGNHAAAIPNEDSRNFEFDDTNLFALNRFPGLDRVEGGPRVSYGVRGAVYGLGGGFSEVLFGQSLRSKDEPDIPENTGLQKQLSDFVGRVTVSPNLLLSFTDRFRLDSETLQVHRNEILTNIGPQYLRFAVSYAKLQGDPSLIGDREQFTVGGVAQLTQYWQTFGTWTRDLVDQGGTLGATLGLRYMDECSEVVFSFNRSNFQDRQVQPSTSFTVHFRLRNLG